MNDISDEKKKKRKKLIKIFVIVNFLVMLGVNVWMLVMGIITDNDPEVYSFNMKKFLLFSAGTFAVLVVVELFLGYLTYKGKKWAAIMLILCDFFTVVGIFGVVAAIIELKTFHYMSSRS